MTKQRIVVPAVRGLVTLLIGGTMVMAGEGTRLVNIKQPPLNTTMMGVVKGVSDYHGLNLSQAMVYGLSGHAFLINIHKTLCPSGPYCWKRENSKPLIRNMGIEMTDLGFFSAESDSEARSKLEDQLRKALAKGIPCSLINMENQIIGGFDTTGFFSAQPWGGKFPPAKLSFGTWKELGKEIHLNFYTLAKAKPLDRKAAILASLDYAIDMHKNPEQHSSENYGVGPLAYDHWIAAAEKHGSQHGNWWNAVVWRECREMASEYFSEIGKAYEDVAALCEPLTEDYLAISKNLEAISKKDMDPQRKMELLKKTKEMESDAIDRVAQLAAAMRHSKGTGNAPGK
ncbi:MAG: hypothetical protein HN919_16990 [Verrucomicrobia bacterium]|nr:hypothetical protein [Verrucomicrobiota bacterium]